MNVVANINATQVGRILYSRKKMEDHKTATALSLENVGSSALVETSPAPECLIQDTKFNVDLSSKSQHPASELPTLTSDGSLTQPKGSRPKLVSMVQFLHENWRTGLEIGILTGIILMVWVLFSIPTILYALPPEVWTLNELCNS